MSPGYHVSLAAYYNTWVPFLITVGNLILE